MNARDPSLPLQADEAESLAAFAARTWDDEIVPALIDYIAIPAKSPMFDPGWDQRGLIERVVRDAAAWVESKQVAGLKLEVIRLEGRTPVIFFEVPATSGRRAAPSPDTPSPPKGDGSAVGASGAHSGRRAAPSPDTASRGGAEGASGAHSSGSTDTVCMYGHLDKQPEFNGWRSDLGPWKPKLEGDKLYGRGGADDGYAIYAAITAILALDRQGIAHPRIVGLIETCEESGSYDLPAYIDLLRTRLGNVSLVVCLDSGAGNYDQLWLTTSLRGMVSGVLKVEILTEGIHSGDASGLVPSSFRILRQVLDRLEDSKTGRLLPESFHCNIPAGRIEQARATAQTFGDEVWKRMPWACGADGTASLPATTEPVEALLNRTWRPTLSVTGADGFPELGSAGNVLRPYTAFKLSLRLPPLVDAHTASTRLKSLLEDNAPYNAKVTFAADGGAGTGTGPVPGPLGATGWDAPQLAPWLETALNQASQAHYGAPLGYIGQGGTIPLMSMLQQCFPAAQMMVCGVLGPKSNAHGPNEFLHVPYGKKLTAAVAQVIAAHP